jgi:hypothetical protein
MAHDELGLQRRIDLPQASYPLAISSASKVSSILCRSSSRGRESEIIAKLCNIAQSARPFPIYFTLGARP